MQAAPFYLDCDPGVDDALALAYLLATPRVDLVGVGTVSGNTSSAQAARNALDLLGVAGRDEVPVAVGAHDHLDHPYDGGAPHVHGANGIGGVELPRSPREPIDSDAADLLIALSHEYAGALRVLAIGPLTNLAIALERDPSLPRRIAAITIMGGAGNAPGNITAVAEANVFNDPPAAAAVVAADWDLTIVPLDVTLEHTLSETDRESLLTSENPLASAVGSILDHYFDFYLPLYGERRCALHDPMAAAIAVGGATPARAPRVSVVVDATHGPGRGQTIIDLRGQRLGPRDHEGSHPRVVLELAEPLGPHLVRTLRELPTQK